jgi:hypothetical protein
MAFWLVVTKVVWFTPHRQLTTTILLDFFLNGQELANIAPELYILIPFSPEG